MLGYFADRLERQRPSDPMLTEVVTPEEIAKVRPTPYHASCVRHMGASAGYPAHATQVKLTAMPRRMLGIARPALPWVAVGCTITSADMSVKEADRSETAVDLAASCKTAERHDTYLFA